MRFHHILSLFISPYNLFYSFFVHWFVSIHVGEVFQTVLITCVELLNYRKYTRKIWSLFSIFWKTSDENLILIKFYISTRFFLHKRMLVFWELLLAHWKQAKHKNVICTLHDKLIIWLIRDKKFKGNLKIHGRADKYRDRTEYDRQCNISPLYISRWYEKHMHTFYR